MNPLPGADMVGYAMMRYYHAHQGTWCMHASARCVQAGTCIAIYCARGAISIPATAATSQNVTLPVIPELYSANFLDTLLPIKHDVSSLAEPVAADSPTTYSMRGH